MQQMAEDVKTNPYHAKDCIGNTQDVPTVIDLSCD